MVFQRREEDVSKLGLDEGAVSCAGTQGAPNLLAIVTANDKSMTWRPATEIPVLLLAGRGQCLVQQFQQIAPKFSLTANDDLSAVSEIVSCCRQQLTASLQLSKPDVGVVLSPLLTPTSGAEPDHLVSVIHPGRAAMR